MNARAREASEEERPVIWDLARKICAGYEAYGRRITGRKIPIMVLSADAPDSR